MIVLPAVCGIAVSAVSAVVATVAVAAAQVAGVLCTAQTIIASVEPV